MTEVDLPEFGPLDSEGFRTVSFYKRDREILRVSLHPERMEDHLREDIYDRGGPEGYSDLEIECLKAVAKKIVTKPDSPFDSEQVVLAVIRPVAAKRTVDAMQESFPILAWPALQVVVNVFVKKGLNDLMDFYGVRRVTDAPLTERLLQYFTEWIEELLGASKPGPKVGSKWAKPEKEKLKFLDETIRDLDRADLPTTQGAVAERLEISVKKLYRLRRANGDNRDWTTTEDNALGSQ